MTVSTFYASADTDIRKNQPTKNYSTLNIFSTGGDSNVARGLLTFDLSGLPATDIINSVTLWVWAEDSSMSDDITVRAYRVKRNWVSNQVTWNVYSTGNNWQTAGCAGANDYDSDYAGSFVISDGASGWYSMNLSAELVKAWADGSLPNYGLLFRATDETDGWIDFVALNYGSYYAVLEIDHETPPATDFRVIIIA